MCVVNRTHSIFHACDSHSDLSGFFRVADKEFNKPQWQLQLQHIFSFLLEHSISTVFVSDTNCLTPNKIAMHAFYFIRL